MRRRFTGSTSETLMMFRRNCESLCKKISKLYFPKVITKVSLGLMSSLVNYIDYTINTPPHFQRECFSLFTVKPPKCLSPSGNVVTFSTANSVSMLTQKSSLITG